jgi:hypothetical protein
MPHEVQRFVTLDRSGTSHFREVALAWSVDNDER